jgi:hypothetical protein
LLDQNYNTQEDYRTDDAEMHECYHCNHKSPQERSYIRDKFGNSSNQRKRTFLRNIHAEECRYPHRRIESNTYADAEKELALEPYSKFLVNLFQSDIDKLILSLSSQPSNEFHHSAFLDRKHHRQSKHYRHLHQEAYEAADEIDSKISDLSGIGRP